MDEEDAFLYGESIENSGEAPASQAAITEEITNEQSKNNQETRENSQEAPMDDEDDDDIEIVLDNLDAVAPPPTNNRNSYSRTFINQNNFSAGVVKPFQFGQRPTSPPIPFPRPDENTPPPSFDSLPAVLEDNTSLFDVDIDSLPDKPWRMPGAHQADFFNYNLDELSWKAYVARQKRQREETDDGRKQPFKAFAELSVQDAWAALPPDSKGLLMQTIMASMPGPNPMAAMMMAAAASFQQNPPQQMHGENEANSENSGPARKRLRHDTPDQDNLSNPMLQMGMPPMGMMPMVMPPMMPGMPMPGMPGMDPQAFMHMMNNQGQNNNRQPNRFQRNPNNFGMQRDDGSDTGRAPLPPGRAMSPSSGPRKGGPAIPSGPKTKSYRDKDAGGPTQSSDGLDYGASAANDTAMTRRRSRSPDDYRDRTARRRRSPSLGHDSRRRSPEERGERAKRR